MKEKDPKSLAGIAAKSSGPAAPVSPVLLSAEWGPAQKLNTKKLLLNNSKTELFSG